MKCWVCNRPLTKRYKEIFHGDYGCAVNLCMNCFRKLESEGSVKKNVKIDAIPVEDEQLD